MDNVTDFRQIPCLSVEDQIERKVERMINRLDREFLSGRTTMSEWDYESRLRNIDAWAKVQLKRAMKK
jgi:hypothetical protein